MISQQALFTQMEFKLQQAKAAQTEAQMREALSALQVLCNVVLDSTENVSVHVVQQQQVLSPIMQPNLSTKSTSTQDQTTKFDEANGSSIFDF